MKPNKIIIAIQNFFLTIFDLIIAFTAIIAIIVILYNVIMKFI